MGKPDLRTDGWQAHEEEQRRSWLRLTPAERLAWLEQAKRFAREALAAVRRDTAAGAPAAKDNSR